MADPARSTPFLLYASNAPYDPCMGSGSPLLHVPAWREVLSVWYGDDCSVSATRHAVPDDAFSHGSHRHVGAGVLTPRDAAALAMGTMQPRCNGNRCHMCAAPPPDGDASTVTADA
jgi:hypothetical protein